MKISNQTIDNRKLSVIVFSLFFSWLLAFPFEGRVLYAVTDLYSLNPQTMVFSAIIFTAIGLFTSGLLVHNTQQAKKVIIFSIIICILSSLTFFFQPSILWNISIIISSFLAAASIGAWSYYLKISTPSGERTKTVADGLIFSNILMILINFGAINVSAYFGIGLCIISLSLALFFATKLPEFKQNIYENTRNKEINSLNYIKPLVFLCFFIIVITINSGLMYQVINPSFAHLDFLTSWYWAVPYIVAIFIMRNLPKNTNRTYILFIGIAMIGLAFVGFMKLDNSAYSYLTVNTLMLGACGIFDLFWWSILGEMIDFDNNSAKILGIGLSANVIGVLLGGFIGSLLFTNQTANVDTSILALIVVFISIVLLPPLHKFLSNQLKNHSFLTNFTEEINMNVKSTQVDCLILDELTERENEIVRLLLTGRTYKMVASELFLSENTIKTHIKNIYSKLNIKSKEELIKLMTKNSKDYNNK